MAYSILHQQDPLEKEMATHSSILAWRIPWTEDPGRLQSIGSQRVGPYCSDLALTHTYILFFFKILFHYGLSQEIGYNSLCYTVKFKVAHSCLTLCDPMDYTVHGILQTRILEWVAFPFSTGPSQTRDRTQVSHTADGFFTS